RLANTFAMKGEDRKAERMARRCLQQLDGAGNFAEPVKAYANELLAMIEYNRGRMDAALAFMQRALPEIERFFGPDHIHVGTMRFNIGRIYAAKKEFAAAEPMLSRGLEISERFLGPHHSSTRQMRTDYAA